MKQKRLEAVCSFLDISEHFIDVGCDHGYVAIEMAKRGCTTILATDIHEYALASARKNVESANFQTVISLQKTDGLENIDTSTYNSIVISGMGTSTMKHILDNGNLQTIEKIIIQSNNELPELRAYVTNLGYILKDETVVHEKTHYYVIMCFEKGMSSIDKNVQLIGIYKPENIEYYQFLLQKNKDILNKIPWYKFEKRKKLKKEKKQLEKYL